VTWRPKSEICEEYDRLLGSCSLKRILMSTNIQQRFPWIRGILGSPGVFATTGQEPKDEQFGVVASIGSSQGCEGRWIREIHWVVLSSRRLKPCGGGVEYLHRDPASRRRQRKGKSRIWNSKIWPQVLRNSYPKITALTRASRIANDRPVLSSERAPQINKPATVSK
jgi:hypothetical protein